MTVTIACVYNPQEIPNKVNYSLEWVDKLYRGVKRNLTLPFEFVCLTNEQTNYDSIPLITNSPGYWSKIELFRKDLFTGPVVYFDLDVIICKDFTDIIKSLPTNKLLMVKEPYKDIHNSSIMYWDSDHSWLFDQYKKQQLKIINEYQYNLARAGWLGDQAYIGENIKHDLFENYFETNIIGWVHHKIDTLIDDPTFLIFTSTQKPNNNLDLKHVKEYWI